MAGLFDWLSTPAGQGLLAAGLGAAANANRSPAIALGRGGLMGLAGYNAAQMAQRQETEDAQQREVREMQLRQMREGLAQNEAIRAAARSAYQPAQPGMGQLNEGLPPEMQVPVVPGRPAAFDTKGFLNSVMGIDPIKGMEWQTKLAKDDAPITVAPGASLVDRRTLKPVFTAPKESELPSAVREYEFAKAQGYNGTFEQWTTAQKKAGANSVSLSVNTEKSLLNDIAGGLSKSIVGARDNAQAALGTINTVNRLQDALDTGKVMAGPTSNFRQFGLQIGQVLGVSGKDANERLTNTRQAIQSLAQLELDAAQQMKGQGQITEAERDIIRRAAAGDIEKMTVPELRTLAGTLDKTARAKIQGFNRQAEPLMKNPNAAVLAPFLAVQEPAARKPSTVLRFDAQGNPVKD
jgi:hypothetical protein